MTIFTLLDRLAFLQGMPATIIVLAAAVVAVVAWDYRLVVPALLVAYLVSGLLFVELLDPRLAVVYTLSGIFVTAVMGVTAWQLRWGRPPRDLTPAEQMRLGRDRAVRLGPLSIPAAAALRAALALAALLAAFWFTRGSGDTLALFPPDETYLPLATAGLVALGLVGLAATGEPFASGVGLLLVLLGFELFYSLFEQSIAVVIALAAANLLVALVIAYLAQARYLPLDAPE